MKSKEIHNKCIIIDAHSHPILHSERGKKPVDLGIDHAYQTFDLIKMKKGGVTALFLPLPLVWQPKDIDPYEYVIQSIWKIKEHIYKNADLGEIAISTRDLHQIYSQKKRAIFLTIEYWNLFTDSEKINLEKLEILKNLGVSSLVLSVELLYPNYEFKWPEDYLLRYNEDPKLPRRDICKESIQFITKMNELGMLIDITHMPDYFQKQVIEFSSQPVILSHSNARTVCSSPKNIPDDTLKLLAKKGGAIMISVNPRHVTNQHYQAVMDPDRNGELPSVTIQDVIDHIDHVVDVVGPNHVGIGTDFGMLPAPIDLEDANCFPNITNELVKRGYNEIDISKILGGNLIRILDLVQSTHSKVLS